MKGMHILEQTPIKEYMTTSWIFLILGLVIAVGAFIIFAIRNEKREKDKGAKIVMLCYAVGIGFIILSGLYKEKTGRYAYRCTFDDNVTINDISKNFKIVSVENDIWTVEDKENGL